MEQTIKYIKRTRELFLTLVNGLSIEQINKIPQGFNNNIIWNFGHMLISTQALCYLRSAVDPGIEIMYLSAYQKGSKPGAFVSEEGFEVLKQIAVSSMDKIERDLKNGDFNVIPNAFTTATYGFEMATFEEIIACCLAHESMHLGYASAIKRALG
jgi:DinB family protein